MALHYSKVMLLLALAGVVYLVVQIGVGFVLLTLILPQSVTWLAFAPVALFGVVLAWKCVSRLLIREPVLVIDANGITDYRREPSFAAWEDVRSVFFGRGGFLSVDFRNPQLARSYTGQPFHLLRVLSFLDGRGHWNLRIVTLRGSTRSIIQTAEGYLRWATHQRRVAQARERAAQGLVQDSPYSAQREEHA